MMKNRVVYLSFKRNDGANVYQKLNKYINDFGSLVSFSLGGKFGCVTTTIDCLKINNWLEDLQYESIKTYHQEPTDTMLNHYKSKEYGVYN